MAIQNLRDLTVKAKVPTFECSASSGEGVREAFRGIAKVLRNIRRLP